MFATWLIGAWLMVDMAVNWRLIGSSIIAFIIEGLLINFEQRLVILNELHKQWFAWLCLFIKDDGQ